MKQSEKVIYIAGPVRAKTAWKVEKNIREAEETAFILALHGIISLCPHTNYRFFHGECTDQFWIDATLELMKRCDIVLVLPGWPKSEGTIGEIKEAEKIGMPIWYIQNSSDNGFCLYHKSDGVLMSIKYWKDNVLNKCQ